MSSPLETTSASYRRFASGVLSPDFAAALSARSGIPVEQLRAHIRTSLGECAQTLRLVSGVGFTPRDRLLEVGSGLGLASCYLTRCGFDVTSLEPGGPGFDWHASIGVDVMEALDAEHEHLSIPAERLEPSEHGPFDVIFSNNVLEHVPDPRSVLARLGGLLADGGITVHGCPNYFVPYEPHFGIPLVPARPQLTARLLPSRVRESGLWRSLNFIRAADISAAAAGRGFGVQFRSGVLADSVERLSVDPEFRSRHRVLGAATPIVRRIGITKLLTRIPATWATPMEFALWRGPGTTSSRLEAWNERIAI